MENLKRLSEPRQEMIIEQTTDNTTDKVSSPILESNTTETATTTESLLGDNTNNNQKQYHISQPLSTTQTNNNAPPVLPVLNQVKSNNNDCHVVERSPGGRYVRLVEKLGSGAYKEVYRAYDTIEGIEVAWNVVKLSGMPKNDRSRIINEVRLLERLHHHNIISFHGSWVNREQEVVNFVTEMNEGESEELEDDVFFADAQLDLEDALQEDDDHHHLHAHQQEQQNMERGVMNSSKISTKSSKINSANSSLTSNDNKLQTNNNINTASRTTSTSMQVMNPFASIPPRNKPKRPRDIQWGVFYVILTLLTLFISHLFIPSKSKQLSISSDITQSALTLISNSKVAYGYTFLSTILVYGICVITARHLYRTLPGGDGDDIRHSIAIYIDKYCTVVSLLGLPLFLFLILGYTPHAWRFAILPFIVLIKDVWLFRDRMSTDGKRTFFRELMCMSLDIISRSIRSRNNLQRYIQCMLLLQCILLLYIRSILFKLLSVKATYTAFLLLICGKWTCSIIIRQLGFISSGCIISWFLQMNEVAEQQKLIEQQEEQNIQNNNDSDSASDDYNVGYNIYNYKENPYYPKTLLRHEDDDDDVHHYNNNGLEMTISPEQQQHETDLYSSFAPISSLVSSYHSHAQNKNDHNNMHHWSNNYTLPSLIASSWTISFGSIAQCALLGWITQFIWSCVRKLERLSCARSIQRRSDITQLNNRRLLSDNNNDEDEEYEDDEEFIMQVNNVDYYNEIIGNAWYKMHYYIYTYILSKYSDLGLCHVAAYYKCYTRSAQDAMNVMHASGIEPILHDDITSSMITSFCSAISNVIVIFLSFLLVHHRTTTLVNYDHSHALVLTDVSICIIMACCYVMSFILCQTTLEIVKSSIQTVYVCFAQFPASLHNSFPLIYHRLMRISENSNNNNNPSINRDRSSGSRHSL